MPILSWLPAVLAAAVHVLIFCMESLWWTTPGVRRRFRQSPEHAEATRLLAFNQGFYNLFLAAGTVAGFALFLMGHPRVGLTLAVWNCACMVAAALVLLASAPQMRRGAVIQGAAPLLFLVVAALQG